MNGNCTCDTTTVGMKEIYLIAQYTKDADKGYYVNNYKEGKPKIKTNQIMDMY